MRKRLCRHLMEESMDYARTEFLAKDRHWKMSLTAMGELFERILEPKPAQASSRR